MNCKKIKSYIGFAIKSNNIAYGVDNTLKCRPQLVIFDNNLGQASKRKLMNFLNANKIEYYQTDISKLINKDNCRVIAIVDRNLGQAISKVIKERS